MLRRAPSAVPRARPRRARDSAFVAQLPWHRRFWRFVFEVSVDSARNDITVLAAALAHFILLSLIPLLLVAASIFGVYLKSDRAQQQAVQLVRQYLPGSRPVAEETAGPRGPDDEVVVGIFQNLVRDRGTVGGFGLLALLWIAMRIFTCLQRALDRIWGIQHHEQRPFYWQYPVAFGTIVFVGLFAWFSVVVTSLVGSLRLNWPSLLFGHGYRLPDLVTVASAVVSTCMSILLMLLIYRWLPSARVRLRSAVYGAVVAGVVWEASKHFFTWFIIERVHLDRVYGAMAGVVILTLWSYASSLILLIGAEVVYCHAKWIAAAPVLEEETSTPPADSNVTGRADGGAVGPAAAETTP